MGRGQSLTFYDFNRERSPHSHWREHFSWFWLWHFHNSLLSKKNWNNSSKWSARKTRPAVPANVQATRIRPGDRQRSVNISRESPHTRTQITEPLFRSKETWCAALLRWMVPVENLVSMEVHMPLQSLIKSGLESRLTEPCKWCGHHVICPL